MNRILTIAEFEEDMRRLGRKAVKLAESYRALAGMPPLPGPYAGPNAQALKAWIAKHMPELDIDLGPMTPADVRARLNALTGAGVRSCDTIEDGSKRFLAALQDLSGEP